MNKPLIAAALIFGLVACGQEEVTEPIAVEPAPQAPAAQPASPPAAESPKPGLDEGLARRVKQSLDAEKKIQGGAIDVTATDGVVTLWGTSQTAAERNTAGSVAMKVSGVKSVQNNLKVVAGS